jgi:hypothetical protein
MVMGDRRTARMNLLKVSYAAGAILIAVGVASFLL